MSATGELHVEVAWDGAAVCEVDCALGRPEAARVVLGQAPVEAVDRIRRLHAVCGYAQGAAASLALRAADPRSTGEAMSETGLVAVEADPGRWHDGLVIEALQEHLWRLLRDWPRALGEPALDGDFARLYRALGSALREGEAARRAAGVTVLEFLEAGPAFHGLTPLLAASADADADAGALEAWARREDGLCARLVRRALDETAEAPPLLDPEAPALPPLAAVGLPLAGLRGEAAAAFCARPDRDGVPVETGPLSRRIGHPLLRALLARPGAVLAARLVARLLDLVDAARRLAGRPSGEPGAALVAEALSPAPGVGLSRVDTARGVLLHRAIVDPSGRVAEYAICAPTAWNFHPRGAFALALSAVRGDDEAAVRRCAGLWLTAFDPCVPFRLEVRRA